MVDGIVGSGPGRSGDFGKSGSDGMLSITQSDIEEKQYDDIIKVFQ